MSIIYKDAFCKIQVIDRKGDVCDIQNSLHITCIDNRNNKRKGKRAKNVLKTGFG